MESKEKEIRNTIEQLKSDNKIMKKLATRTGFFEYYFEVLKSSKTSSAAFNKVNKLYFKLFGEKRYSSFSVYAKTIIS